jgi:hypothetical protein
VVFLPALVVVEPVDLDLLGGDSLGGARRACAIGVERGKDRGRRADIVHLSHREQRGRRGAPAQVDAVEVVQDRQRWLVAVPVAGQEARNFRVRAARGDVDGAGKVLQERHIGHGAQNAVQPPGREPGGSDGQPATLAQARQHHLHGIHLGMTLGSFDGPERVNEDAAVVVVLPGGNAARHQPGVGHVSGRYMRIRGLAEHAAVALAAGVHNELRVACLGPFRVLLDQAAPARIADVLHHHGQCAPGVPVGRQVQPALDPRPSEARKGDVEAVNHTQVVLHRCEGRIQREFPGLRDGPVPELVEVNGFDGG